jgi:hypothetical protein
MPMPVERGSRMTTEAVSRDSRSGSDLTIDATRGTVVSLGLVLVFGIMASVPYVLLWGVAPIVRAWKDTSEWTLLGFFLVAMVAHEAIHGLTWLLAAHLKWSDISFGVNWRALAPFAHAKVPIPLRAYRIGAAMPGIALGVVPVVVAVTFGSGPWFLFGTGLLVSAAGDALILWLLRGASGELLVQDHPTRFGCTIMPSSDGAKARTRPDAIAHAEASTRG